MSAGYDSVLRSGEKAVLDLRLLYERHGYKKYKMSRFEEYRLYLEHKSFLASDRVITFTDLDGRLLALKPDVTLSIVKNAALSGAGTGKFYYVENVYRPKGSGFAEIKQAGLEFLGDMDGYPMLEVVTLARESLAAVSPSFSLAFNHIAFAEGLLSSTGLPRGETERLRGAIASKSAHILAGLCEELALPEAAGAALRALPSLYGGPGETLARAEQYIQNAEMQDAHRALAQLSSNLEQTGAGGGVIIDLSMLADTEYYNGVVLRGHIEGLPEAVLSGGQYGGLLRRFGCEADAAGFALYLDRLELLEPGERDRVDVALLCGEADAAAVARRVRELTGQGLSVHASKEPPEGLAFGRMEIL